MSTTVFARSALVSHMQSRPLTTPTSPFAFRLNRLPWTLTRGIDRYVLGRTDHRDATVMAQAEPSVRQVELHALPN